MGVRPMIVLVGETRDPAYLMTMQRNGWGRVWTVGRPRVYPGEPWGFDNGAYSYFRKGKPLDEDAFLRRLDRATNDAALPAPDIAVLPDMVGKGMRSAAYSMKWAERLADHPWRNWYFAVQDGQTGQEVGAILSGMPLSKVLHDDLPGPVHPLVRGVFLGGTDPFKRTATFWSSWAHHNGLKFHYGRASTPGKIRAARHAKADSMDTSFPLWERERFQRFVEMWTLPDPQSELRCM